ncbi:MAG: signal peptidase II [Metamycoplasmataceae bacterium]
MNFKNYFKRLKLFIINKWNNEKKYIIRNYIIFFSLVLCLILIDLLTKEFIFQWNVYGQTGNGEIIFQNPFIGFRSIANPGLTFINFEIPVWLVNLFSVLILFFSTVVVYFCKSWTFIIWSIFTFAGTFGNFYDRAAFNGVVRDIIYFPFLQGNSFFGGTFNFADMFVVFGSISGLIFILILAIDEIKRNRQK